MKNKKTKKESKNTQKKYTKEQINEVLDIFQYDPILCITMLKSILYWEEFEELVKNGGFVFTYNNEKVAIIDKTRLLIKKAEDYDGYWYVGGARRMKSYWSQPRITNRVSYSIIYHICNLKQLTLNERDQAILNFLNKLENYMDNEYFNKK